MSRGASKPLEDSEQLLAADRFCHVLVGSGFQPGVRAFIGTDAEAWQPVIFKTASIVVLKGGDALAQKFPVGTQVPVYVVNPDGTQTTVLVTRTA